MDLSVVELSRLQFALTALYHFLFVPLTIGLAMLIAIMESVWVMTERPVWRAATRFWGTLFGINFAMGVATGMTLEFQFGTNWAYYAHYVGDVFGVPLALEGLMAFFLEATLIGLFFLGWSRLGRIQHLAVTWGLAVATNLSALWVLIANGWMSNPVGARFNPETMRMELTSLWQVFFNPVAQAKVVHTVSAAYVTGAVFVLAVSAFYLLRRRHLGLAKRSMTVAASFGLASALSVVVLGDESGYVANQHQRMKVAAIEALWETEDPPAAFTVFGIPDREARHTHFEIRIPWLLGLIATRSVDEPVMGINDLVALARHRIERGLEAYRALQVLRRDPGNEQARLDLEAGADELGYALLLKRHVDDPLQATEADIDAAAFDTVPGVGPLFWAFRIMAGLGFYFIALFAVAFVLSVRRRLDSSRLFLWVALLSLPAPWLAAELGWIVAEYGRQPWVVVGVLPTFLGASQVPATTLWASLGGLMVLYTLLLVVDVYLMVRVIRRGPQPEGGAP